MDLNEAAGRSVAGIAAREDIGGLLVRRWLGCWIDFVAVAALFFGPAMVVDALAPQSSPAITTAIVVGLALALAYFPALEGRWGRTVGKLVTGLVVVDAQGRPPGYLRAIVRTLLRLLEVNPLLMGGIPAGVIVLLTKKRQRLGDLVAGTFVVPLTALQRLEGREGPVAASVFD
jgi:uncharacterized RDD family membrane protein YckC